MRSDHIAMSWKQFEQLPPHPGWKHEYWDGMAHITPAARSVVVRIDVHPRPFRTFLELRAIAASDEPALVSAYLDAFRDTVEYCDWDEDAIADSAVESLRSFFEGRRGEPLLQSSFLATDPDATKTWEGVAGAALLVWSGESPMLDMLLVRPRWHRRGLGTALASRCLGALHRRGEPVLRSRYHLANEPSQAWHHKFGFVEEPDLLLARVHLRCAAQELQRREKMVGLGEERERLVAEKEAWARRVADLERIADEQGWEAVSPGLRFR